MDVVFKNVNKFFISSFTRKKIHAVKDLSLNVNAGEIFGIVGPNGAGKSTLLKMLLGFIKYDSGIITIAGRSPSDPDTRTNLGYLPENPYYYDHLSAEDLMKFSASTGGMDKKKIPPRMDYLLETLNLDHARTRRLRTYSKGMTQRAGICFALVHDPDLIIFDEPMSGLDPLGRKLVVDLVLDLKKQSKTIIFCSHILNDIERLCDRMVIMDNGKIKRTLDKNELLTDRAGAKTDVVLKESSNWLEQIFVDTVSGGGEE